MRQTTFSAIQSMWAYDIKVLKRKNPQKIEYWSLRCGTIMPVNSEIIHSEKNVYQFICTRFYSIKNYIWYHNHTIIYHSFFVMSVAIVNIFTTDNIIKLFNTTLVLDQTNIVKNHSTVNQEVVLINIQKMPIYMWA